jgi:uncharacterized protein (TIGR02996 family)
MTDDLFLDAILESPEDDLPRQVYADWLTDRGDPRGELIHLQLRLARAAPDDPALPALRARAAELLERHAAEWLGPLRPWLTRWTFRRGFLDSAAVTAQAFLDHAKELRRHPTLRHVEIDLTGFTPPPHVAAFIPASVAEEYALLPLGWWGDALVLAMRDPGDRDTLERLDFILNRFIEPLPAPAGQITAAIHRTYGPPGPAFVSCMLPTL